VRLGEGKGEANGEPGGQIRQTAADGEGAVLRHESRAQEGLVDPGGGQAPRRLHPGQRPRELAHAPQARRSAVLVSSPLLCIASRLAIGNNVLSISSVA
jgi:hypothetical protein